MTHRDRYPRTLNEAFGPYSGGQIEEPKRPADRCDRLILAVCACCLVAVLAVLIWGK